MKILFIGLNGFDLAYSRVRCYSFSELLRGCGHETDVFTFQEKYFPGSHPDYLLNLRDCSKVALTFKAMNRLWPEKETLFYLQKVHYHAAAPYLLSRLRRNSYILDYDDWDIDRSPFFDSGVLNKMIFHGTTSEKITANVASRARACVVSTEPLKRLMERYNDEVYLIPTVTDTDKFKPKEKIDERVTFVWTGMVWGKVIFDNVMFVAECFRAVYDSFRESELIIVGKGGWYDRVREEVEKRYRGLPIAAHNWVSPDEMPAFLSRCDAGVLPLIPDSENEEWMRCKCPTKLFEFMAMGMPTVSSDFGEARNIIQDGEDGFLANSREEFVQKMKLLAGDRGLRTRMGERARGKAVARYSLRSQRNVLCKVIDDMSGCGI